MIPLALVLLCSGPLVLVSTLLMCAGLRVGIAPGMSVVCSFLLVSQLGAAAAVSALYRYCFARPVVRGTGLLAALVVTLAVLSDPWIMQKLGSFLGAVSLEGHLGEIFVTFVFDTLFFVAVAGVVVMLGVLLVEVPIRWTQGDGRLVYDGAYRVARSIVVLVLLTAGGGLMRGEFLLRLGDMLRRLAW